MKIAIIMITMMSTATIVTTGRQESYGGLTDKLQDELVAIQVVAGR